MTVKFLTIIATLATVVGTIVAVLTYIKTPIENTELAARETSKSGQTSQPQEAASNGEQKSEMEHLFDLLKEADTFFKVGLFEKAASEYEKATHFIPDWAWEHVDSQILEAAREDKNKEPQRASRKYQNFFSPLREK
uniref:Uncharacterized protein n=1 Tax=Candidatus Kentrum eta TaxID=2126337 RepID=A0A450UGW8_9GAMM|nr:MAG: hypothetical protein BECKH772A_GA0070896_100239 [Candidatus Kentron sp. H]VFJ91771.1 MAG: hypothetical protein BECKH772B_GA0070898_100219 [Candidatus Kentron sp. H]VFJ98400.1 MAG: hypothetical protein BECKH772C_GA0070978_100219 [Candidatus Kentron sp. H]